MKEKIKKVFPFLIALLVLGGAFYWYEWRPTQIRKECFKEVLKDAKEDIKVIGSSGVFQNQYSACLAKNGLGE